MNLFEVVKASINTQEAAQTYGIDVNHHGMALCPFHNARHPSLYVSDDHYHCFACGEHGDVIDLTAKLFDLRLYDAARKLASDFHLAPDKPLPESICQKWKQKTKAQQLRENEQLCFSVLSDYAHVLRDWKVQYAPQSPDEPVHARFVEACRNLDQTEYQKRYDGLTERFEKAKARLDAVTAEIHQMQTQRASIEDFLKAFAAMPDKLTAEMIKNNFIAHGSDIFPKLLNALTQPGSEDDRPPAGLM